MPLSSHVSLFISFVESVDFHQLLLVLWFPWFVFAEELCRSELQLEKHGEDAQVNVIF